MFLEYPDAEYKQGYGIGKEITEQDENSMTQSNSGMVGPNIATKGVQHCLITPQPAILFP